MNANPFQILYHGLVPSILSPRLTISRLEHERQPMIAEFGCSATYLDALVVAFGVLGFVSFWFWVAMAPCLTGTLWARLHRGVLAIDDHTVTASVRRPFGQKREMQTDRSGYTRLDYTTGLTLEPGLLEQVIAPTRHLLVLRHGTDRRLDVPVFSSVDFSDLASAQAHLSSLLNVPAKEMAAAYTATDAIVPAEQILQPMAEQGVEQEIDWRHPPEGISVSATDDRITLCQTVGLPRLGLYRTVAAILVAPFSLLGVVLPWQALVFIVIAVVISGIVMKLRGLLPLPNSHKMTLYRRRGLLLRFDSPFFISWRWIGWKNLLATAPDNDHLNIRSRDGIYSFGTKLSPQTLTWLGGYLELAIKD